MNFSAAPAVNPGEEGQYGCQKSAANQPFWIFINYNLPPFAGAVLFNIAPAIFYRCYVKYQGCQSGTVPAGTPSAPDPSPAHE
ncbi:hypothetical protein [uncultured Oscillibacter sp.]|uniref:hypothetical protein n=1 Tax=uncultured Oscillibacter sp. TaxID=876091 RepID=UPI00260D5D11|nr:hypothetical protein [uncultured Oscillibacter sp.]